jgi:hypothetical protein
VQNSKTNLHNQQGRGTGRTFCFCAQPLAHPEGAVAEPVGVAGGQLPAQLGGHVALVVVIAKDCKNTEVLVSSTVLNPRGRHIGSVICAECGQAEDQLGACEEEKCRQRSPVRCPISRNVCLRITEVLNYVQQTTNPKLRLRTQLSGKFKGYA